MLGPCCGALYSPGQAGAWTQGRRALFLTHMPTVCYTHSPDSVGLGQRKLHNIYQYLINTSVKMAIFVLYVGTSIGSLRLKRQEIYCISP